MNNSEVQYEQHCDLLPSKLEPQDENSDCPGLHSPALADTIDSGHLPYDMEMLKWETEPADSPEPGQYDRPNDWLQPKLEHHDPCDSIDPLALSDSIAPSPTDPHVAADVPTIKIEPPDAIDSLPDPLTIAPFRCDLCDNHFTDPHQLTNHMRLHSGQKLFQCSYCPKEFAMRLVWRQHELTHNDSGDRPFSCELCDTKFKHKCHLNAHRRVVHERSPTNQRPFSCDLCAKTYKYKQHLAAHMRVHTDQRPFSCDRCDKSFKHKHNLAVHRRMHERSLTEPKPFGCELCDAQFKYKQHLIAHRREHSAERPFSCDRCDQTFRYRAHLEAHQRKHGGEKPFRCPHCSQTFAASDRRRCAPSVCVAPESP